MAYNGDPSTRRSAFPGPVLALAASTLISACTGTIAGKGSGGIETKPGGERAPAQVMRLAHEILANISKVPGAQRETGNSQVGEKIVGFTVESTAIDPKLARKLINVPGMGPDSFKNGMVGQYDATVSYVGDRITPTTLTGVEISSDVRATTDMSSVGVTDIEFVKSPLGVNAAYGTWDFGANYGDDSRSAGFDGVAFAQRALAAAELLLHDIEAGDPVATMHL